MKESKKKYTNVYTWIPLLIHLFYFILFYFWRRVKRNIKVKVLEMMNRVHL